MNGSLAYVLAALGVCRGGGYRGGGAWSDAQRRKPDRPDGARSTRSGDREDADALRGDPRKLKPGDIVEIRGVSYAVRGSLHLVEGGWSWAEHLLDDAAGDRRWLSVEEDPDLELVLWRPSRAPTVTPGAPTIDFAGRRYTWDESGQARFTAVGNTGLDPTGTMRYHDYQAPGDARLSFEAYGEAAGRWAAVSGCTVAR